MVFITTFYHCVVHVQDIIFSSSNFIGWKEFNIKFYVTVNIYDKILSTAIKKSILVYNKQVHNIISDADY